MNVDIIDVATMKGVEEVDRLRRATEKSLEEYVTLAHRFGFGAEWRMEIGTDVLDEAEKVCRSILDEYPRALFFLGRLIFQRERFFQRILHNETAYQLQRRMQFAGMNAMVLPVRVIDVQDLPSAASGPIVAHDIERAS